VPREDVLPPIAADDRGKTVDAVAQVDWLAREEDPDCPGEKKHPFSPESGAKLGQVPRVGADDEANDGAAGQRHLHQDSARHPRLRRG
jgi:hypothetical protein